MGASLLALAKSISKVFRSQLFLVITITYSFIYLFFFCFTEPHWKSLLVKWAPVITVIIIIITIIIILIVMSISLFLNYHHHHHHHYYYYYYYYYYYTVALTLCHLFLRTSQQIPLTKYWLQIQCLQQYRDKNHW